jgi:hypothetical protein
MIPQRGGVYKRMRPVRQGSAVRASNIGYRKGKRKRTAVVKGRVEIFPAIRMRRKYYPTLTTGERGILEWAFAADLSAKASLP